MATLILTAVGSAVGGQIGAAIGAMIGQKIDQRIFAPKAREGARLAELTVQGSAYGAALPKIFGTMRVAGNVIWATDLREERHSQSQGKGKPKLISYSYSASFAVALSARPGRRIGRIWADGKLLRGAAGDLKADVALRLYNGQEDQPVDPLIAAAEGGRAPAYRGLCYAVFENLALEDFGNRIPFLSFELVADDDVSLGAVMAELGEGDVEALCPDIVTGLAVDGGTLRGVLAPWLLLRGLDAREANGRVEIGAPAGSTRRIDPLDLGARGNPQAVPTLERTVKGQADRISLFRLAYADPARDFQPGEQRAELFAAGRSAVQDATIALDAGIARQWALDALLDLRARDDEVRLSLPWSALDMGVGDILSLPGLEGSWRVVQASFEAFCLALRLCRCVGAKSLPLAADGGRGVGAPDLVHGPTHLVLAELPALDTGAAALRPVIVAAAAGPQPGWRRAELSLSTDGGNRWTDIGSTAAPGVIGTAGSRLNPASPHVFDRASRLIVDLLHDGMALYSIDEDALLAGGNLLLVGAELIQFSRAERIGPARYQLSNLLRGRRGTELDMTTHQTGEDVLLITSDALVELDVPLGAARCMVMASGLADASPVTRSIDLVGRATRPLSPVHLTARPQRDGSVLLSWIRRSRQGWDWSDRIEAPLVEESENYRVSLLPEGGPASIEETSLSQMTLSASRIAEWRAMGIKALAWNVSQIGTFGTSSPAGDRVSIN